jgi:hypothetical protein
VSRSAFTRRKSKSEENGAVEGAGGEEAAQRVSGRERERERERDLCVRERDLGKGMAVQEEMQGCAADSSGRGILSCRVGRAPVRLPVVV